MAKTIFWVFPLFLLLSCQSQPDFNEKGKLLAKEGKYEEALTQFDQATQNNPEDIQGYLNSAQTYVLLRQPEKAFLSIKKALQEQPKCIECHLLRAQIFFLMQKEEEGEKILDELVENNAKSPTVLQQLSQVYLILGAQAHKQKNYIKAQKFLESAQNCSPNSSRPLLYQGFLKMEQEEYPSGLVFVRQAVKQEPELEVELAKYLEVYLPDHFYGLTDELGSEKEHSLFVNALLRKVTEQLFEADKAQWREWWKEVLVGYNKELDKMRDKMQQSLPQEPK